MPLMVSTSMTPVRDQQAYPTEADLEASLESLSFATFSLSGDLSRAHRLIWVREADWPAKHNLWRCKAETPGLQSATSGVAKHNL